VQGGGGEHANFYSDENGTLAGHDAACTSFEQKEPGGFEPWCVGYGWYAKLHAGYASVSKAVTGYASVS
jgi:hypothetical protein